MNENVVNCEWNGFDFNRNFFITHNNQRAAAFHTAFGKSTQHVKHRANETNTKQKTRKRGENSVVIQRVEIMWALYDHVVSTTCLLCSTVPSNINFSDYVCVCAVDGRRCRCRRHRFSFMPHFNIEIKLSPRRLMPKNIAVGSLFTVLWCVFYIRTKRLAALFPKKKKKWIEPHCVPLFSSFSFLFRIRSRSHIRFSGPGKLVQHKAKCVVAWNVSRFAPFCHLIYCCRKESSTKLEMCGQNGKPLYPHIYRKTHKIHAIS